MGEAEGGRVPKLRRTWVKEVYKSCRYSTLCSSGACSQSPICSKASCAVLSG